METAVHGLGRAPATAGVRIVETNSDNNHASPNNEHHNERYRHNGGHQGSNHHIWLHGFEKGIKHGKHYRKGKKQMSDKIIEVGGRGGYGYGDMGLGGGFGMLAALALLGRGGFGGFGHHGGHDGGHHGGHGCCMPEVKACGMEEVQHKQDFIQKEIADARREQAKDTCDINAVTVATGANINEKLFHIQSSMDQQFCSVKGEIGEAKCAILNKLAEQQLAAVQDELNELRIRSREDREIERAKGIEINIANSMAQAQAQQQQQLQFQTLVDETRFLKHALAGLVNQTNYAPAVNRTVNLGTMTGSNNLTQSQANTNVA